MRRWLPGWVLVLTFIVLPVAEIYVLIQVGHVIGAGWTVLLLLADGVFGGWLIKHEGRRTWLALRTAIAEHRVPAKELADSGLVLVGGTLIVAPGFITDVLGLLLALPLTRPLWRTLMAGYLTRRFVDAGPVPARAGARTRQRPGPGSVVQGEVVDEGPG